MHMNFRPLQRKKIRSVSKNENSFTAETVDYVGQNLAGLSRRLAASANRRFEFQKSSQLFIRVHDETLSVAAMRVSNPDCSPVGITRRPIRSHCSVDGE
jgi:hypothetical protein